MKNHLLRSLILATALALVYTACQPDETLAPRDAVNGQEISGQYIVVYNTRVTGDAGRIYGRDRTGALNFVRSQANDIFLSRGLAARQFSQTYAKALNGVVVTMTDSEVERIRGDRRIAYIEKDRVVTLAPPPGAGKPGGGGGGGSTGQQTPWGIMRVNGVSNYTGSNVAWIIDTGIDLDHPDLNVDVARSVSFLTGGGGATSPEDQNGHGSHVAGTIAAINNSTGVIGVAPGATVVAVRVLDRRGSGTYSGVIAGIDYVAANGSNGDVANMSLGGSASQALDDAVVAASSGGIKFCLAAGNESDDANNHSPARANGPNIYTISAMSNGDNWASFSNYGNPPVDYCAPGVSVLSCWKDGGYNTISGTSMATPHAAGVLLLGSARASGTVNGDPDNDPDTIISH